MKCWQELLAAGATDSPGNEGEKGSDDDATVKPDEGGGDKKQAVIEEQDSSLSQLPEQASVDQEMKDGSESKEDATLPGLAVNTILLCLLYAKKTWLSWLVWSRKIHRPSVFVLKIAEFVETQEFFT